MIELAREAAPQAEFYRMDLEKIEFPEQSFEGLWASSSLLHIPKSHIPQIFAQIHTLLKQDGIFFLSLKQGVGEVLEQDQRYDNAAKFWSFFKKDEIVKLLQQADFEILECHVADKCSSYYTHSMIRVFCKKR